MTDDSIFEILGHQFKDRKILEEALTHASSADHRLQSNERMEFLGDAILGYVVCEYLFATYPQLLEGELTKIKSAVVSRKVCARISSDLDLCSVLTLGKGMSKRSSLPDSVAAAVFESIIAAIYLDGGIEKARGFVLEHVRPYIDQAADSTHQSNFKSVLQQYAQRHNYGTPSYVLLDEKGPDHSKAFEVCVELQKIRYSAAWANSKKEAEQKAALQALQELEVVTISEQGEVTVHEQ
ncbi:MAG: ribonuclease III [Phycisphaeraceae bacterium]|nr:ribonuclease III [Phycisphaeraceae bacterium]